MRNIIYLILISVSLLCCLQPAAAQRQADTSQLEPRLVSYRFRDYEYAYYTQQGLLLQHAPIERLGSITLGYSYLQGGLRARQEADKVNVASLRSEGLRKVKKITLQGYFGFTRSWEDSIGYMHSAKPEDPTPYYLLAIKQGHWDRLHYELGAQASTAVLNDKLLLSVGADFDLSSNTRNSDPRPEISKYALALNWGVGYRITPKHTIGAWAGYAYGIETTNVGYSSVMLNAAGDAYREYQTFLSKGFGNVLVQRSGDVRRMREDDKGYRAGGYYDGKWMGFHTSLLYKFQTSRRTYVKPAAATADSRNDMPIASFDLEQQWIDLFMEKHKGSDLLQLRIRYNSGEGSDYNNELAGNNYIYNNDNINAHIGYVHYTQSRPQYELFLKGYYDKTYKADGTTSHRWSNSYATIGVDFSYYTRPNADKRFWVFNAHPAYRKGIDHYLTAPTAQQTFFTTDVLMPNTAYYARNAASIQGGIAWQTPWKKQMLKFGADARYEKAADLEGRRVNLQAKVSLFY